MEFFTDSINSLRNVKVVKGVDEVVNHFGNINDG